MVAPPALPARCPDSPATLPSTLQVIAAVTQFVADHGLAGKPLILWGASSGGTLALKLPGTLAAMAAEQAAAVGGEAAAAGQVAAAQAVVGPTLKIAGIISGALDGQTVEACSAQLELLAALGPCLAGPAHTNS